MIVRRVGWGAVLVCAAALACNTSPKRGSEESSPPQTVEGCAALADRFHAECVALHERGDAVACPEGHEIAVGPDRRMVDCRHFFRNGDEAVGHAGWEQECDAYRKGALSQCKQRLEQ